MGWNDRMDHPEYYGEQYARDYSPSYTTVYEHGPDEIEDEDECPHDASRHAGDGFEECLDCGATFYRLNAHIEVA